MSTWMYKDVICGCCGEETTISEMGSYFVIGYSDLDGRPPEPKRTALRHEIHTCPHCGYTAPDLADPVPNAKEIISTEAYKNCNGLQIGSEAAKEFVRWAILCSHTGDATGEMYAYVHAAWACDDAPDPEPAKRLRAIAAEQLMALPKKEMGTSEVESAYLLLADLLRRSGQFHRVFEEVASVRFQDPEIVHAVYFELKRAFRKDDKRYAFAEGRKFVEVPCGDPDEEDGSTPESQKGGKKKRWWWRKK